MREEALIEAIQHAKDWEGKEPPKVTSLGKYPIAYPGLTLYHGLSGSLKSFGSVVMANRLDYDIIYYLDFEGNSIDLKSHCKKNDVNYINLSYGDHITFFNFISGIFKFSKKIKVLVIIDSFSRVFIEPVNETHKIDEIFKQLKFQCTENNYSLLIIDHSRRTDYGIDIRGGDNKKKFADVVLGTKKVNLKTFTTDITIEKSRLSKFSAGSEISIKSSNMSCKDEFILLCIDRSITNKTECNRKLSKKQREIYKEYIEDFDLIKDEISNIKDEYE